MAIAQHSTKKVAERNWFDNLSILFNTPHIKVRASFFRLMAISQEVGLWLRESVVNILKSEGNRTMQLVQQDIITSLSAGQSFATSLEQHPEVFATHEVELIRAAEGIGNLPTALKEIANEMENMQKIYQKIQSAVTYPTVLLVFSFVAIVILLIYVIPTIVSLFPDTWSLPWITLFMLGMSDFLRYSWFVIIIALLAIIIGSRILYQMFLPFKKIVDKLLITLPVVKEVTRTYYMYRFSKLLGDFSDAWVSPIISFQQITKIFSNYYYQRKAWAIQNDLRSWFSLSSAIEWSSLFDEILIQTISVGENTGNLGKVLLSLSQFYRYKFTVTIESLMSVLEPALMAFVAIIIGIIVSSIFLPIADLVNVIAS